MTDTNQKLREAIKRLLKAHRITVQAPPKTITDAENQIAEIQNAVKFAEEALALPTAAPVGEREAFEQWAREQFYPGLACPSDTWYDERKTYSDAAHHMAFCAFKAATQMTEQAAHEEIARLRAENAALSAGDAVDAQRYRLLRTKIYIDPKELILRIRDVFLTSGATLPEMLDAAIDAAMRKGQL